MACPKNLSFMTFMCFMVDFIEANPKGVGERRPCNKQGDWVLTAFRPTSHEPAQRPTLWGFSS